MRTCNLFFEFLAMVSLCNWRKGIRTSFFNVHASFSSCKKLKRMGKKCILLVYVKSGKKMYITCIRKIFFFFKDAHVQRPLYFYSMQRFALDMHILTSPLECRLKRFFDYFLLLVAAVKRVLIIF